MRVDIVSIFPEALSALDVSLMAKARERGLLALKVWNLRDFAADRHKQVDDVPYGGGPGMVMKPEPFFAAVEAITAQSPGRPRVLLTSPQGRRFDQRAAEEFAREPHLIILCGRYEGVDERVVLGLGAEEISIGDYVLNGGELAAMVIVETVARLLPGVVGDEQSVEADSFTSGLLDYPHYTRPAEIRGLRVPEVLLSGHHEQIRKWRRREQLRRTLARRPDLIDWVRLSDEDRAALRGES
ncbi:MAG: tRNA (guanosine(37)-N1)-methyltransferase TrmD [Armatimonadota bacterium]|nr:tRNA (guanosine(37)-N1)-methyltransferase TrmD [Armatimonadota bacterium]